MNSCSERYEYSLGGDVILTIPQSVKHTGGGGEGYISAGFLVACLIGYNSLIKKKTNFPSYIRKFRRDRLQSHICGRVFLFCIGGNAQIFPHI